MTPLAQAIEAIIPVDVVLPGCPIDREEFVRAFLHDMSEGRFARWSGMSAAEIEREAGNGGLEIQHWLFMASATRAKSADVIYYEPMLEWMTGMGGIVAR